MKGYRTASEAALAAWRADTMPEMAPRYYCASCPGGSWPLLSDAAHHRAAHDAEDELARRRAEAMTGLVIEWAARAAREGMTVQQVPPRERPPDPQRSYQEQYREFERTGDLALLPALEEQVEHPGVLVQRDVDAMLAKRDAPPPPVRRRMNGAGVAVTGGLAADVLLLVLLCVWNPKGMEGLEAALAIILASVTHIMLWMIGRYRS